MQMAAKPEAVKGRLVRFGSRLAMPALLLLITIGFWWKLVLTDQYTWLESPDLANQVLPWFQFQAGEWRQGHFPMWDPYLWGGQSLIGQAQPGAAYPLNWILFLLPLRNGWIRQSYLHWYYVLIHFVAVLFCYWLCRDLKRSRAASLLGGLAFGFSGYVGTTDWPQMLNGAVWVPLVFLFMLRALNGLHPLSNAALSGAFLGMAWLSGHHQIPTYITLAAGGVWLYHALRRGRPDWRVARLAAVFLIFTFLAGALQMLPAYEYGKLARRWVGVADPVGWNEKVPYVVHTTYALYPLSLLGIVIPGLHRHSNPFAGVVVVSLAVAALAGAIRVREVRLFGMVSLAGLLFSLGHNNVLHGIIYAVVPLVEKARTPSMATFIFQFGLAVVSAYGFDTFLSEGGSRWPRRTALVLALFAAFLLLLSIAGIALGKPPDDRYAMTALVALLLAGVVYGWHRGHLGAGAMAAFCALLLLIDLGNVAGYFLPHNLETERPRFLKKMSEHADVVEFLRKQPWPVRVDIDSKDVPYNLGDWYGVDVYGGYVASLPVNLMDAGMFDARSKMLHAVNYALAPKPTREGQVEVYRGQAGLNVYRNPEAFPRVWTVHEAVTANSAGEGFDLRRKAFLRGPAPALEVCEPEADLVRLTARESNRVEIRTDLKCRGMVVLAENWFPGWRATVDGKPAQILESYGALRGVVVERGRHRIEMRYRPASVYAGALLSVLGFAGAVALALVRRKPRPL